MAAGMAVVEAVKRQRQGIQGLDREARERLHAEFEHTNGYVRCGRGPVVADGARFTAGRTRRRS